MNRPSLDSSLDSYIDTGNIARRLSVAGISSRQAGHKAAMFGRSAQALIQSGVPGNTPVSAWFVPGRMEVLGKHTDYAGGRSLTAAVERGFCAIATKRDDSKVSIIEVEGGRTAEFPFSPTLSPTPGDWTNYPMTVTRRIARNFGCQDDPRGRPASGVSIAFTSDLPLASGMSSSSALVITMMLLLRDLNKLEDHPVYQRWIHDPLDLSGYAATIENGQSFHELDGDRGVGTFGGSEDHTAILTAIQGELGQYSYCPVRKERSIKMPPGFVFAIASSGVVAEKTGAAMKRYNDISRSAAAIAQVWRDATGRNDPHIAAALAATPQGTSATDQIQCFLRESKHPHFSAQALLTRFQQFYAESEEIIPSIPESLQPRHLVEFGKLVQRSQQLAETHLGNQVPETISLAKTARELGSPAASAFGAGFGGSVWALVGEDQAPNFLDAWADRYLKSHPDVAPHATFFQTFAGPGALSLSRGSICHRAMATSSKIVSTRFRAET